MFALLSVFGLEQFARRFLVAGAVIIAFGLVFTVFVTSMGVFLSSFDYNAVPSFIQTGFKILPSNTDNCISTIIATKAAAFVYDYQLRILDYRRS